MTRMAIVGYGNLGKACERIAFAHGGISLTGIFTRRKAEEVHSPFGTAVYSQLEIENFKDDIDVAIICTGSANDVMGLAMRLAQNFNTVDSFDTHAKMPEHFENMNKEASESGHLSFVGIGWDPGLFSVMRGLFSGIGAKAFTFWGRGVSQGHGEAIRRLEGVRDAVQYTIPDEDAIELAKSGETGNLTEWNMHKRECFVVLEDGADAPEIEKKIKTMQNYFAPYEVTAHFVDEEQLKREHGKMSHAGRVIATLDGSKGKSQMEFSLTLPDNPEFTASVLVSYALANARLHSKGEIGARCALDIPISALLDCDYIKTLV